MERAAAVIGDVIGDIDQGADGAQADGAQAGLHPVGARAVLQPAHQAQGEGRAQAVAAGKIEGDAGGAGKFPRDLLDRDVPVGADAGGGKIAGDAGNAEAVGAVGGDGDLDHRVVEAHQRRKWRAGGGIGLKLDDAAMFVRQAEFALRAQHAVGGDAANGGRGQHHAGAGNGGAGGGEDAAQAGPGIGGAAHHLHDLRAGIDHADAQAVGIGVGLGALDVGDDEGGEFFRRIVDMLDLEADHGQRLDDLGKLRLGVEMLFQPGQGEFHRLKPPNRVGRSSGRKP